MNYKIRVNNPREWSQAVKLFADLGLVAHQRYLDLSGQVEYPFALVVDNGKFDYNWSCFGEGELPSYEEITLDQLENLAAGLTKYGDPPVNLSECEVTPSDILEAQKIRAEQLAQEEQIGDEVERKYYQGFNSRKIAYDPYASDSSRAFVFSILSKKTPEERAEIFRRGVENMERFYNPDLIKDMMDFKPKDVTRITIESYGRKHISELPSGSDIHELLTSMFLLLEQASWQRDTIRDGLYELLDEWGMIERPADLDFEQGETVKL